jgi:hypothetical protein
MLGNRNVNLENLEKKIFEMKNLKSLSLLYFPDKEIKD